jgi:hypothetical protein
VLELSIHENVKKPCVPLHAQLIFLIIRAKNLQQRTNQNVLLDLSHKLMNCVNF